MRIAVIATWHRRNNIYYYAKALRMMGHDVVTIGPWRDEEPFGVKGREPDYTTERGYVFHYSWDHITHRKGNFDLALVIDGGEDLQVYGVPIPWAHMSTEGGPLTAWGRGLTPHRYSEIMCNGQDADVRWLPKAFDEIDHVFRDGHREYDLVQLASAREARRYVWEQVRLRAPDLSCVFGDIWGPMYSAAYQNATATYTCSTVDFVTNRVFEAMAMGCVVIADRTSAMLSMFEDSKHFVGFDPIKLPQFGEGIPDPEWLIETVRHLRDNPSETRRLQIEARLLVADRDSYRHRMERVLTEMAG